MFPLETYALILAEDTREAVRHLPADWYPFLSPNSKQTQQFDLRVVVSD